jgi:hypothetical protein
VGGIVGHVSEFRASSRRLHAGHVDIVLDRERQTEQRHMFEYLLAVRIHATLQFLCLRQQFGRCNPADPYFRTAGSINAFHDLLHQFDRTQLAIQVLPLHGGEGERGKRVAVHVFNLGYKLVSVQQILCQAKRRQEFQCRHTRACACLHRENMKRIKQPPGRFEVVACAPS